MYDLIALAGCIGIMNRATTVWLEVEGKQTTSWCWVNNGRRYLGMQERQTGRSLSFSIAARVAYWTDIQKRFPDMCD